MTGGICPEHEGKAKPRVLNSLGCGADWFGTNKLFITLSLLKPTVRIRATRNSRVQSHEMSPAEFRFYDHHWAVPFSVGVLCVEWDFKAGEM